MPFLAPSTWLHGPHDGLFHAASTFTLLLLTINATTFLSLENIDFYISSLLVVFAAYFQMNVKDEQVVLSSASVGVRHKVGAKKRQ